MVRTQSNPTSSSLDASRILAYSTAIALHALAAGLLLVPLANTAIRDTTQSTTEVRWVEPKVVPVTPKPPPLLPVTQTQPPPSRPALPQVVQPPAIPVFATEATLQFTDSATPTEVTAPAEPAAGTPAPPAAGAQLQYLRAPAPTYPRDALLAGVQGTVTLRVLVDESGKPIEVKVERSSGNRALDNAARSQVLRQWRFQPALDNGQPIQAIGLVPVTFSLQ